MKLKNRRSSRLGLFILAFAAPHVNALEFEPSLALARNALVMEDLPAARNAFALALQTNPQSEKALAGFAICDLILVFEEPDVKAFLDRWQFSTEGRDAYNWNAWSSYEDSGIDNPLPPNASLHELATLLEDAILPKLQQTIAHLDQIQSPDFELYLRPEYFGDEPLDYDVTIMDYTDVQLMRSGLLMLSSLLRISLLADNMDLPMAVLRELARYETTTLEETFSSFPDLGTLRDGGHRTAARVEFKEAIEGYVANAAELRLPERRAVNAFYIDNDWDLEKEAYLRSALLGLYAALEGPALVTYNSGWESISETIDLRPVFSPSLDWRPFLPAFEENLIKQDSMPDPTLQGMLPDFARDDWSDVFASLNLLSVRALPLSPGFPSLPGRPWTTSSYAPWSLTNAREAQSGALVEGAKSWIETVVHGPAELLYDLEIQADDWSTTYLSLYIDGIIRREFPVWESGSWATYKQRIGPGPHEVRWEYQKAYEDDGDNTNDRARLTNVQVNGRSLFLTKEPDLSYRLEVRGSSQDGSLLVGTRLNETSSRPMVESGAGLVVNLPINGYTDWFITASDILPDGTGIVGRMGTWDGELVPALWSVEKPYSPYWKPATLPVSYGYGRATGIAKDIIVGQAWNGAAGAWEAAAWVRDPLTKDWIRDWRLQEFGSFLPGYTDGSWLYSVNDDGSIAAGWSDNFTSETEEWFRAPTYWTGEWLKPLPVPDGYREGEGQYCSGNGTFILGSLYPEIDSPNKPSTVIWRKRADDNWSVEVLPVPDTFDGLANAAIPRISDDGNIVTTTGAVVVDENTTEFHQMVWQRGRGWLSADAFLASEGVDFSTYTVDDLSINPDGSMATGVVTDSQGHAHTMVYYRNGVWTDHPLMGEVYRQTPEYLYSPGMGHVYVGLWPHIYLFENNTGWMRHVRTLNDGSHILYGHQGEWVIHNPGHALPVPLR